MADGRRLDPQDDGAEQAALVDEAKLIRRVRWRLVAWSGVSTLVILVVLGAALYAAVANSLAAASVQQLENRARPLAELLEGPTGEPGEGPEQGFVFGGGNTVLFIFDAEGNPVQLGDRPVAVPSGLPETAGITAAHASPTSADVRTATLELSAGSGPRGQGSQQDVEVPVRIMTREVVAQQDGNTYYLQVLQDRSTEVETLQALLTVLLVGGVLVVIVAVAFGWIYAERALVPIRNSLGAQRTSLRRQREFAADASHELRTPLTVIRSSLEHVFRHPDRPVGEGHGRRSTTSTPKSPTSRRWSTTCCCSPVRTPGRPRSSERRSTSATWRSTRRRRWAGRRRSTASTSRSTPSRRCSMAIRRGSGSWSRSWSTTRSGTARAALR